MLELRRSWRTIERVQAILAVVLAGAAMAFALLPHEWIEERVGVEPDGGSGVLELLPVAILAVVAVVLAVRVVRSRRAAAGLVTD